ncbi:CHAT domain-containing tetratricopeptide repeat protein [Sphingosinicella sp. LHD-64]|uniref:CHAT domain-containing protein n=1 Tax=Sphingosinicella sp. LHD-64 TaxID=3072139 RepID=UPI00280E31D4|nr:CHAT domain-containing tetratricopeptide repeat protein [Sphingosinicella sp. LHD-64]MDQ8757208.1 CHAT domain-containing tetratricopeptide repeat protein [Sphingosinicella sp. LHD-64]
MNGRIFGLVGALATAALMPADAASAQSIALQDSFRIGSGSSLLCSAQPTISDRVYADMFDRGYAITCRDAAVPVGSLYALRARAGDPAARLAEARAGRATCQPGEAAEIEGLGPVQTLTCRLGNADVAYRVYLKQVGSILYAAEGLGGYDSVLRLGLRSVVADREVPGDIDVATTGAGDPVAFARVQASSLDPQRALDEAYRRNNAGNYAESAEFFAALTEGRTDPADQAEALANEALQKSNLGNYAEADALFARAADLAGGDPVNQRRLRNYRTMHLLNQGRTDDALAELDRVLAGPPASEAVQSLVLDRATAAQLTAESPGARRLGGLEGLSPEDKAQVLDGQALQLRGTALRLQGRSDEAVVMLNRALDNLVAIRGGRVAATVWMRAQILGELARIAESRRDLGEAERQHRAAVALLEGDYPASAALFSAKGRLAGFYVRTGQGDQARGLYREIVGAIASDGDSSASLRRILNPYFGLLAERGNDPEAVADFFAASQVLVRPGVAQTQAVLARELSGGSDEASRLFRQSVNLTRDIERTRVDLARLEALPNPSAAQSQYAGELRSNLTQLQQDQVATQAQLAAFPRYRAVATNAISLADLQTLLRPGEAYYKMLVAGNDAYAVFVTADSARIFRIGARPGELEQQVDALRRTITVVENGQQITYPFDLDLAHRLYGALFTPVEDGIGGITHLVFEPDGAMLRLPPNLLVMDQASIDAYRARAANPDNDGFDFRGVAWFGRERDISTAVSARAFRDVRTAPPSRATGEYLGFGQNATTQGFLQQGGTRAAGECDWSLAAWNRPISASELYTAQRAITGSVQGATDIVTGEAFTDTAIKGRENLNQYRILHFATHGLVAPPRPECPAQPALLTSFGGQDSDGLLTFSEIFDLRLDADLVVLSACDTAGRAGAEVTAAAGLTTGGDFALDGLVRAFVGAGGRIVVASHWPVPDDFNATERLISGLFAAPQGTGTSGALRLAQRVLMDDPATSHPYYWAAFAVVGDGVAPVIRPVTPAEVAMVR